MYLLQIFYPKAWLVFSFSWQFLSQNSSFKMCQPSPLRSTGPWEILIYGFDFPPSVVLTSWDLWRWQSLSKTVLLLTVLLPHSSGDPTETGYVPVTCRCTVRMAPHRCSANTQPTHPPGFWGFSMLMGTQPPAVRPHQTERKNSTVSLPAQNLGDYVCPQNDSTD